MKKGKLDVLMVCEVAKELAQLAEELSNKTMTYQRRVILYASIKNSCFRLTKLFSPSTGASYETRYMPRDADRKTALRNATCGHVNFRTSPSDVKAPETSAKGWWRPIPGYENRYEIAASGECRSKDRITLGKDGRYYRFKGRVINATSDNNRIHVAIGNNTKYLVKAPLLWRLFVGPDNGILCKVDPIKPISLDNLMIRDSNGNILKMGKDFMPP